MGDNLVSFLDAWPSAVAWLVKRTGQLKNCFTESLLRVHFRGRDKRANIAALRQGKIYPLWQAAAAAMWIVAAAIHEMEHFTS